MCSLVAMNVPKRDILCLQTEKISRLPGGNSDTATLAAHLIYWSTLYAIKTQSQHQHEFYEWLAFLENGTVKYDMEEEYVSDSFRRKQRKYWRETVANDSAIDWVWNIGILKKKLEFNIGY